MPAGDGGGPSGGNATPASSYGDPIGISETSDVLSENDAVVMALGIVGSLVIALVGLYGVFTSATG